VKIQLFDPLRNCLALVAGFALAFSLSGCRSSSPPPANNRASSPSSADRASAPQFEEEGRSGRRRSRRGHADAQAAPGTFDFYLLNLSWSPEFCATHRSSSECGRGLGFVVHGMWPQDTSGDYPEDCSDAPGPSNPQAYTDLIPTASLVEHEWQTHGTCSGLSPDAYFAGIRRAYAQFKAPADIGTGSDADGVTPDNLLARFERANPGYPAGSVALSCGNNRLTAVEICLTKDLQPEACQGVRSCQANVVKVTSR
jgi:ribonuclease T2